MTGRQRVAALRIVRSLCKSRMDTNPPGSVPECPFIYHHPKKPKKKN